MGMFRWQQDGKTRFYEIIALESHDDTVEMRFKHLNRGMVSWEEKEEYQRFVLVELREREAIFFRLDNADSLWLVYRGEGNDKLVVHFDKPDETVQESDKFIYYRSALP